MRGGVLALAALLAMTSSAAAQSVEELARALAGRWTLTHIAGAPVRSSGQPMGFTIAGTKITGFDGCNSFGGDLTAPERIVATQMACTHDTLTMPLDLANLPAQLRRARLEGGSLRVAGTAGRALRFKRSSG